MMAAVATRQVLLKIAQNETKFGVAWCCLNGSNFRASRPRSVLSAKAIQLFASGRAKYYGTVGQLTDISQFTAVHSTVVIHGRGCVMCIAKNNIRVAHLHAHLVGSFAQSNKAKTPGGRCFIDFKKQ